MKTFFITATGTNLGKTYLTTHLCRILTQLGFKVRAIKPVISGWNLDSDNDTVNILKSLGLPINDSNIKLISPWRLTAPLSPDIAANLEGKIIDFNQIVNFCLNKEQNDGMDFLLIEGAGGIMTPLTGDKHCLDLAIATCAEVILITGSYLGSISHTLTALASLGGAQLTPKLIVINQSPRSSVSISQTKTSLNNFSNVPIEVIPHNTTTGLHLKDFTKLTELLIN